MRVIFGCLVAVLVSALFGLILGEYQLRGVVALIAGLLFGLAVAEASITTGKTSAWLLVGVSAASAFGGFTWAASIDAGDSLDRIETIRWVGSVLALVSAGWWVRAFGSRVLRSPIDAGPEEAELSR